MDGLKSAQGANGGSPKVIELLMEITLRNQLTSLTINTQLWNMLEQWHRVLSHSTIPYLARQTTTIFCSV